MILLHIKYTSLVPCGCRDEDFFMYFHCKSMVDNEMPGAWPLGAPLAGFKCAGLKRSPIHCSTKNMKALSHVVWETNISSCFSNCKSMGIIEPLGCGHF